MLNKCTKTKPKPELTLSFKNFSYVFITVHNCHTQHNTEQL